MMYDLGEGWVSVGNSGHDGPMVVGGDIITTYSRDILLDAGSESDYDIRFKLRHRAYDGTLLINGSRDLSGQHFGVLLSAVS